MRADTVWEPGDKSDDWRVMKLTCARPILSAIFSSAAKKQKDKMRSEMKAGGGGGGGRRLENWVEAECKETKKVNNKGELKLFIIAAAKEGTFSVSLVCLLALY